MGYLPYQLVHDFFHQQYDLFFWGKTEVFSTFFAQLFTSLGKNADCWDCFGGAGGGWQNQILRTNICISMLYQLVVRPMPSFRDLMIYLVDVAMLVAFNICLFTCLPLMEEILLYLGCIKPCKHWDKLLTSTGERWIFEPSTMRCAKCH